MAQPLPVYQHENHRLKGKCVMLKQILSLSFAVFLLAGAANAQDKAEITRAQAGKDCRSCNLFQADLAYKDVPGINLSDSRLRQANLSLATLNKANLSKTNLSIANLFGARLTSVDLSNANLERATLVGAYLGSANLKGATLTDANLSGAELETTLGLTQTQLNTACGDATTKLPSGLTIPACR